MTHESQIQHLKTEIGEGRVVVVVGTGIAIWTSHDQEVNGFRVAHWDGLLKHGVHQCQKIEHVLSEKTASILISQIESGETDFLISAAELITQRLKEKSPGIFRNWLKESVGSLTPQRKDIIETLAKWPIIFATLNYDSLIENITGFSPVTWDERDKVGSILREGSKKQVLHIHGYYDQPDSVILGLNSYNKVAHDPHTQTVMNIFTISHTLLFIGCGDTFNDPNFNRLIEWGKASLKDSTSKHYILCKRQDFEKFIELQKNAPWLYPIIYGNENEDILSFIISLTPTNGAVQIVANRTPRPQEISIINLSIYAKAILDTYSRLKLESLDPTGSYYSELKLWSVFTPQKVREVNEYLPRVFELPKEHLKRLRKTGQLEEGDPEEKELNELRRRYLNQIPRDILEIVNDNTFQYIVVLGDPGSGKSSLLQSLMLQWAKQSSADLLNSKIPVLIELGSFAQYWRKKEVDDFLDFIGNGRGVPCKIDVNELKTLLDRGQVRLFFDGLDEIFDVILRDEVINAIHRFINEYPQVPIIITSRVFGYKNETFQDCGFRHFMLQELNDDQIAQFLENWHRITYQNDQIKERDEKHQRLLRAISDSRPIRDLAGNPLLITMMAIVNRYQDLPRERFDLYEECSKLLLQQWKVEEFLRADPDLVGDATSIGYREKQEILRLVARNMQNGSEGTLGNIIPDEVLENLIEEIIKKYVKGNSRAISRALIKQLRIRNFILCYIGGDSYAFIHRTFLEYFCSDDLKRQFEHSQTIDLEYLKTQIYGHHWHDETWHEVLCLLSGSISPNAVAKILVYLLEQDDSKQSNQNILLVARCIGEIRKGTDIGNLSEEVKSRLSLMLNQKFQFDSFVLEIDDLLNFFKNLDQAISLRVNIWYDEPDTYKWILDVIEMPKKGISREKFIETLIKKWELPIELESYHRPNFPFTIDSEEFLKNSAVIVLAKRWKDQDTVEKIKSFAKTHSNPTIRSAAIHALARYSKDDPDTQSLLKSILQSESDSQCLSAALEELSIHWKDDPLTYSILKSFVRSNDSQVRRVAILRLSQEWSDNPETFPLLKSMVQTISDDYDRGELIKILAKKWKEDPEILLLIKSFILSDVQSHTKQELFGILAGQWNNDLEIQLFIKSLTKQDQLNDADRRLAIMTLAENWKDDPGTLSFLKNIASSLDDIKGRNYAILTIASHWKADPESLILINKLITGDNETDVRQSALRILTENWKKDPNTLLTLIKIAENDPDTNIRKEALRLLYTNWKVNCDITSLIMNIAKTESVISVKTYALEIWSNLDNGNQAIFQILKSIINQEQSIDGKKNAILIMSRYWRKNPETLPFIKDIVQQNSDYNLRLIAVEALLDRWNDSSDVRDFLNSIVGHDDANLE
ncbi:MAG: HEAT repeat domain-containing protein [Methanoregula sp.]